jgi:DNA-binding transcriptional MerR regulator
MRIGELAKRSNVTVRTIRYYIEQGLLPAPPRKGKYGDFDETYVQRLRLILQLKAERLSLPAIRGRLAEFGLVAGHLPEGESGEGLFRSRFAQEAGLAPDQVARLEAAGLLESSEGLIPPSNLPLARALADLLAWGATIEDIQAIAEQTRREAKLHGRMIARAEGPGALARALQWQQQIRATTTIRQILLQRWTGPDQEEGS